MQALCGYKNHTFSHAKQRNILAGNFNKEKARSLGRLRRFVPENAKS
jgi:hypothetical protein